MPIGNGLAMTVVALTSGATATVIPTAEMPVTNTSACLNVLFFSLCLDEFAWLF